MDGETMKRSVTIRINVDTLARYCVTVCGGSLKIQDGGPSEHDRAFYALTQPISCDLDVPVCPVSTITKHLYRSSSLENSWEGREIEKLSDLSLLILPLSTRP